MGRPTSDRETEGRDREKGRRDRTEGQRDGQMETETDLQTETSRQADAGEQVGRQACNCLHAGCKNDLMR